MKKVRVWKVTVNGRSAVANMPGVIKVYPVGKAIRPDRGMGPLMAFRTREDARKFARICFGRTKVRRAEGVLSRTPVRKDLVGLTCVDVVTRLKEFWKTGHNFYWYSWPSHPGTVYCYEITCLE